ncbi:hypothetical protein DIURU_001922 [Diutina rugosa]|uniref:Uncharacterized protein n=1 Tax=Diutina rugosa TaxID=5481 RepID=A0A642USI8_DIURU|nr:uncharacterized protein DIURU_001922 [Diutina rugosa]KAA8904341.1 hypothetical protein DIURU_001922 [Diutina rugosa]
MNLMDMLSGGDSPYDPSVQLMDEGAAEPAQSMHLSHSHIYYLPTLLTTLQRELVEVVISMFRKEIDSISLEKQSRTRISNLVDAPDDVPSTSTPQFSNFDKIRLLFDQLMIIDKHPSLLVDHFIPRKLILSELNERVLTLSTKLQMIDRVVDGLIDGLKSTNNSGYHMLLVAQSAREIELVEGLIIGKDLYYQNLSNSKLYDDKCPIPSDLGGRLVIYMITSSQLYNNYIPETIGGAKWEHSSSSSSPEPRSYRRRQAQMEYPVRSQNSQFNLIMSLDTKLDPSSPSLEFLRPEHHRTPMIIPVPVNSIEHIVSQLQEPSLSLTESYTQWQLQVIEALIMNWDNPIPCDESEFYLKYYGANLNKLLPYLLHWHESEEINLSDLMEPFNRQLGMGFSTGAMLAKLATIVDRGSTLEQGELGVASTMILPLRSFDYESFKSTLAEILNNKLINLSYQSQSIENSTLMRWRSDQTKRQLEYDIKEDDIAAKFRKLRRVQEDATSVEQKLTRYESYYTKYQLSKIEWDSKINFLRASANKSGAQIREVVIPGQQTKIKELSNELETLTDIHIKLDCDYESLREKYQGTSADAVQLSSQLRQLKQKLKMISSKAEGSGATQLPSSMRRDAMGEASIRLKRCRDENDFLKGFIESRIDRVLAERHEKDQANSGGRRSRQGTPI